MLTDAEIEAQRARHFHDKAQRFSDENAHLRAALERLEKILSPEAMRGDTVIDEAYDVVFRTLAALESGAM